MYSELREYNQIYMLINYNTGVKTWKYQNLVKILRVTTLTCSTS